jgi:hypothetical protein
LPDSDIRQGYAFLTVHPYYAAQAPPDVSMLQIVARIQDS